MFTTLFTSADVVASSLTGLAIMSLAAAIICFLGLSWSNERWRVPAALVGTACLVTAVYYAGAAGYWFNASEASAGVRFSAWYSVHPLQVVWPSISMRAHKGRSPSGFSGVLAAPRF